MVKLYNCSLVLNKNSRFHKQKTIHTGIGLKPAIEDTNTIEPLESKIKLLAAE